VDEPTLHLTIGVKLPTGRRDGQDDAAPKLKPRPSFSLPFSATAGGLPAGADFIVRLNAPVPTPLGRDGLAATEWRAGARTFRFPRSMASIIGRLSDGAPWVFPQLVEAVSGDLDEASLRFLLGMLVTEHLVEIRAGLVPRT